MQPFRFKSITLATLVIVLAAIQLTASSTSGNAPSTSGKITVRNRNGKVIGVALPMTLADLTNMQASVQVDDKIFENWRGFSSVATGGAVPADAALISVMATGEGTCEPGPGLLFVSSQFSVAGIAQSQRTIFSYDVRTASGQAVIDDVRLALDGFQATLAGAINVTETVNDPNQNLIGTLSVQVSSFGVIPPAGADLLVLTSPRSMISVTKNIFLANGGVEDQGSASLGQVGQNVSEVCGSSLQVTKRIACLPCVAGMSCADLPAEAYSGSAIGFKSDTASPIFCYSITVTNSGAEALQNISVVDSSGLDLSGCFTNGLTLPVGGSTNCFVAVSLDGDSTNTVTVTADGAISLTHLTSSASATASVVRATIACPADVTVQCAAAVPAPSAVTASLNCDEPATATSSDQVVPGTCPNRFTVLRTYTASDQCSNQVSCLQTITVNDTTPPVLTGVPGDLTVQCLNAVPSPAAVTANDSCDGVVTPMFEETQTNPGSSCNNLIIRTWTATDSCGNVATATQHITLSNTTPPVITQCASNITLCASAGIPPPDTSLVVATDSCGGLVTITVLPDVVQGNCPQVITRTYVATDSCSNQATCVQTITANCAVCNLAPPNPLPVCGSTGNTLSGPAGLATYSWSDSGSSTGWVITAGTDIQTITYSAGASGTGVFTLTATDTAGCASTCSVTFGCSTGPSGGAGGCRVTGGSNKQTGASQQPCITTPPPDFVSHGGQVGAPLGVPTPFTANSACIRGEWQHTRHSSKKDLVGSLHAAGNGSTHQFDSLMCACLSCPENPNASGLVGTLCNPGDRTCGPEPPRAPANKICFSGVGDYTFTNAKKTVKAVFRVDIEDRGRSGGKGAPPPLDRYRIRLWILDSSCGRAFDADSAEGQALRLAVSCADPLTEAVNSSAGLPDIDDGGDMTQGNHQIHPLSGQPCQDISAKPRRPR